MYFKSLKNLSIFSILVTAILFEFPTSPEIITISGFIVASADPTCSEEEISSLVEAAEQVDEGLAEIESALEEAEGVLEGKELAQHIIFREFSLSKYKKEQKISFYLPHRYL